MLRFTANRTHLRRIQTLRPNWGYSESPTEHIAKACFSCLSSIHDSRRTTSRQPPLRFISLEDQRACSLRLSPAQAGIISPLGTGQTRAISSWLPEVVQNFSIWGGTGVALKAIHMDGVVPYWACFAIMSVGLRTALIPLVVYSAKNAARFAKVAPELQFIITLFQSDLKKMRAEGKSLLEQRHLFLQNLHTVQAVYKLHNINPLLVFLSPLLQIPFFYYVAVDLRKIVNGQDPELAQELTESGFLWAPDLTDPDPWFGLPIAAGAMLYMNVEVAVGRRSLSGETASKSDFAVLLKDLFQTLAVFMPCLASQSPAGLQVYLLSSFTWTLFQGAALRNDTTRSWMGLPSMGAPPTEPKYAKEFMEFKKLEQEAREIRGDGPVLGKGILAVGFETSFPGSDRPTTIKGSDVTPLEPMEEAALPNTPKLDMKQAQSAWGGEFIHGISAPMEQLEEQLAEHFKEERAKEMAAEKLATDVSYMSQPPEELMEAANRGAVLAPKAKEAGPEKKIDATRFRKTKRSKRATRKR